MCTWQVDLLATSVSSTLSITIGGSRLFRIRLLRFQIVLPFLVWVPLMGVLVWGSWSQAKIYLWLSIAGTLKISTPSYSVRQIDAQTSPCLWQRKGHTHPCLQSGKEIFPDYQVDSRFITHHQEEGSLFGGGMGSRMVGEFCHKQEEGPGGWFPLYEDPEVYLQFLIDSLCFTISLRVVG